MMRRGKKRANKRSLFCELMAGLDDMRKHRDGRLTLRTHLVESTFLAGSRTARRSHQATPKGRTPSG
jgi:hypothetical protein